MTDAVNLNQASHTRYASVDALRGITVAAMLLVNTPGDWSHVYAPLLHAAWHGLTPTDLVFPFFLFVVGVSIALGVVPRVEAGVDRTVLSRAVLWRACKIIALGLALHLLAFWLLDRAWFRPWGVLQRIGVCFAVAGLVAIHLRARWHGTLVAALLLGYWAMLAPGGYDLFTNLASRIDSAMLGPLAYQWDADAARGHDPEGLLSTLPAIATTLLGLRAGAWLRAGALRTLAAFAVFAIATGCAWAWPMPINKNLWTSSYVLVTAGCAAFALLLCHVAIDRHGWPAWGRRFGVNAIAAYVGSAIMVVVLAATGVLDVVYRRGFADWMTPLTGPAFPSLAFAVAFVALWWAIVAWMDRRGWHVKV